MSKTERIAIETNSGSFIAFSIKAILIVSRFTVGAGASAGNGARGLSVVRTKEQAMGQ
jgi:hypothetical protein